MTMGLKDDIRAMCSMHPLTHKQYTDIAKAQSAACACDAHLKSSAAAAAVTRKRPSTAAAWVNQRPHQRSRVIDSAGNVAKVVKWQGDDADAFPCTDMDGSLAEPLPSFFKDWIAGCPTSENGGKSLLPINLLKDGKLTGNQCFYKGCMQASHRWDHCLKLAMHVAKNPAVRSHS